MSKGSPRRTLRVPQPLIDEIEAAIESANVRRFGQPYDWSGWALQAIGEKLRSLKRGRESSQRKKGRRRRQAPVVSELTGLVLGVAHAAPSLV
jgi:hypothetical protein